MHPRRFARLACWAMAAAFVWSTLGSAPASAQEAASRAPGLVATEAVTTVMVDPATASFTVQHTYRLSNTASDETFAGFYEIFPPTALDVTASVGGVSTTAVSVPVSAGFAEWFVPFPEALTPDSSPVDVVVRWRASGLTGDPNAFDRVSEGVVSIAPYAVGRGAEAELIVEIPGDYDVVVADGYDLTTTDTGLELRAHRSIEEQYVALPVVVEAPDQYVRRSIDGPIDVTVATPDGSSDWLGDDLGFLVEELARWVPIDRPEAIEFRQGYTGGADLRRAEEGAFVLPLDASPAVALRAIAIAWLDPLPFDDPALRTDYAAALADRVSTSQGVAVSPRFGRWVIAMTALASVSDADITATVLTSLEGGVT
ncbi:MAG: hypothetical protein VW623_11605, partial [Acidimicrobiaceae bacterium]